MSEQHEVVPMTSKRLPRVVICMPSRDTICTKTFNSSLALHADAIRAGLDCIVINREASMITGNRNDLVDQALGYGADWLMWIDSDMTFPPDALARLLRRGKDIVAASYCKRVPPYEMLGFLKPVSPIPEYGVAEAHYMPAGMMLVKADIYRKLSYPWYYETYRQPGNPVDSFFAHMADNFLIPLPEIIKDSFRRADVFAQWLYDEQQAQHDLQGRYRTMSEDYNFCRKVIREGFTIWCDLDLTYQMGHVGDHVVTTNRLSEKPSAEAADAA